MCDVLRSCTGRGGTSQLIVSLCRSQPTTQALQGDFSNRACIVRRAGSTARPTMYR
jgi:hypothetical protein